MSYRPALPSFVRGLALDAAQRERIGQLTHKQAIAHREKSKAAQRAMNELRQVLQKERLDEPLACALAENAAHAQDEMAAIQARFLQEIDALLNAEQRNKMAAGKKRR